MSQVHLGAPISLSEGRRDTGSRSPLVRASLVLLVSVLVTGGVWLWVAWETPAAQRPLVATVGGVTALLACAAAAFAVYRDGQLSSARGEVADRRSELERLTDDTLPAAVNRLREGASADTVLAELPPPSDEVHARLLRLLVREISVGERQRAAAMSACANAAGRVQAMATSMLADLREMEHRHSEDVLGDLLSLDHSTAQAGRLADSIAVLTGARSGRRWTKPIVMESILRGAMGRIRAYQRVRLHSTSTSAIVGYAAEDVMHALAELMDNATKFSAPSEEVHVYVEQLHTGVVITVEDGGLGMKPQALERAERSVSSTVGLDLTKLSGSRLGLAVVGCLARKHKLQVYFRPSSRGGTGVVLRIPNHLVTQPRQEQVPAPSGQTARRATSDPRTSRAEATVRDRSAVSGAPSATTATLPGTPRPERTTADTTAGSGPSETTAPGTTAPGTTAPGSTAPGTTTPGTTTTGTTTPGTTTPGSAAPGGEVPTGAPGTANPWPGQDADDGPPSEPQRNTALRKLPKRRRGETLASAPQPPRQPRADSDRPRSDAGARFGAFRQALRPDKRDTPPPETRPDTD